MIYFLSLLGLGTLIAGCVQSTNQKIESEKKEIDPKDRSVREAIDRYECDTSLSADNQKAVCREVRSFFLSAEESAEHNNDNAAQEFIEKAREAYRKGLLADPSIEPKGRIIFDDSRAEMILKGASKSK